MTDVISMPTEINGQQPDIIVRLQGVGGAELLHGQTTADFKTLVQVTFVTPRSVTPKDECSQT